MKCWSLFNNTGCSLTISSKASQTAFVSFSTNFLACLIVEANPNLFNLAYKNGLKVLTPFFLVNTFMKFKSGPTTITIDQNNLLSYLVNFYLNLPCLPFSISARDFKAFFLFQLLLFLFCHYQIMHQQTLKHSFFISNNYIRCFKIH